MGFGERGPITDLQEGIVTLLGRRILGEASACYLLGCTPLGKVASQNVFCCPPCGFLSSPEIPKIPDEGYHSKNAAYFDATWPLASKAVENSVAFCTIPRQPRLCRQGRRRLAGRLLGGTVFFKAFPH